MSEIIKLWFIAFLCGPGAKSVFMFLKNYKKIKENTKENICDPQSLKYISTSVECNAHFFLTGFLVFLFVFDHHQFDYDVPMCCFLYVYLAWGLFSFLDFLKI